jgi:DNA-binding MarR family transcriptional regulator
MTAAASPPSRETNELALKLGRVTRMMAMAWKERFRQEGVSPPQFWILSLLRDAGPVPTSRLCDVSHSSLPTVSGVVDNLVAAGLVRRTASEEDRRVVLVELSAKGQRRIQAIEEMLMVYWGRRLEGISPTARRAIDRGLDELLQILESDRASVPPEARAVAGVSVAARAA